MRDFLYLKYDCSEGKGALYLKQSPSSGFGWFGYHINTELSDFYRKRGHPEINNNMLLKVHSLPASGSYWWFLYLSSAAWLINFHL